MPWVAIGVAACLVVYSASAQTEDALHDALLAVGADPSLAHAAVEQVQTEAGRDVHTSIAELEARLATRFASLEGRIAGLEGRMTGLEGRMTGIEAQYESLNDRMRFMQWGLPIMLAICTFILYRKQTG